MDPKLICLCFALVVAMCKAQPIVVKAVVLSPSRRSHFGGYQRFGQEEPPPPVQSRRQETDPPEQPCPDDSIINVDGTCIEDPFANLPEQSRRSHFGGYQRFGQQEPPPPEQRRRSHFGGYQGFGQEEPPPPVQSRRQETDPPEQPCPDDSIINVDGTCIEDPFANLPEQSRRSHFGGYQRFGQQEPPPPEQRRRSHFGGYQGFGQEEPPPPVQSRRQETDPPEQTCPDDSIINVDGTCIEDPFANLPEQSRRSHFGGYLRFGQQEPPPPEQRRRSHFGGYQRFGQEEPPPPVQSRRQETDPQEEPCPDDSIINVDGTCIEDPFANLPEQSRRSHFGGYQRFGQQEPPLPEQRRRSHFGGYQGFGQEEPPPPVQSRRQETDPPEQPCPDDSIINVDGTCIEDPFANLPEQSRRSHFGGYQRFGQQEPPPPEQRRRSHFGGYQGFGQEEPPPPVQSRRQETDPPEQTCPDDSIINVDGTCIEDPFANLPEQSRRSHFVGYQRFGQQEPPPPEQSRRSHFARYILLGQGPPPGPQPEPDWRRYW